MTVPTKMVPTPWATNTVSEGVGTDTASEFWQRVSGNVFIVYENVPYALGQHILQSRDPDTAIAAHLVGYQKRVAGV